MPTSTTSPPSVLSPPSAGMSDGLLPIEKLVNFAASNIPNNEVAYVKDQLKSFPHYAEIGQANAQAMKLPDDNKIRVIRALNRLSLRMCHHCLLKEREINPMESISPSSASKRTPFNLCQACCLVYYCSEECKANDLPKHALWCRNVDAKEYDKSEFMPVIRLRSAQ